MPNSELGSIFQEAVLDDDMQSTVDSVITGLLSGGDYTGGVLKGVMEELQGRLSFIFEVAEKTTKDAQDSLRAEILSSKDERRALENALTKLQELLSEKDRLAIEAVYQLQEMELRRHAIQAAKTLLRYRAQGY